MSFQSGFLKTDDDVQIRWTSIGEGPPILCSNGVGVGTFFWKYISEKFSSQYTIVLWDYRGHGESDRRLEKVLPDVSIQRHTKDLELLYQELFPHQPSVILMGHSMGCQVALEFQRRNPQICSSLILMLGAAGKSLDTFAESRASKYIFRVVHRVIRKLGSKNNQIFPPLLTSRLAWPFAQKFSLVDPLYMIKEDFYPYLTHMASMDMRIFLAAAWQCQVHNCWPTLSQIDIPTLIIAAEKDSFFPVSVMRKLHQNIPHSEFLILSGGSHAAIIEQPETINYRISRFLTAHSNDDSPHPQKNG